MRPGRLAALLALVTATLLAPTEPSAAEVPVPDGWPAEQHAAPRVGTAPNALRVAGPDRTQTALAAALTLEADGPSGPFGTPGVDDAPWGLGRCPFTVIIAADDVAADALAAASLSDPTTNSSEPLLVRSATADPFFDPVGGTSRVDTDVAPILLTASARRGVTTLSPATRTAVERLSRPDADTVGNDCATVDAAIVVGGAGAVAPEVDDELIGLGLDEVFRVEGEDRFATAAAIADALGTGPAVNAGCVDADVTDGDTRTGWYGNAAVEFRRGPTTCAVLGRAVAVADGLAGIDALTAGWWTSTWQVPVLLVGDGGVIPDATADALDRLPVDHLLVLGGTARIPDAAATALGARAGATVHRIAGADRYATSVAMAETFGGWFATGDGADHAGSLVCVVASGNVDGTEVGWPDALTAGPWCGAAGVSGRAPVRGLGPTFGAFFQIGGGEVPAMGSVPIVLTPSAGTAVDPLADWFDPVHDWCAADLVSAVCVEPGFVVAFGGEALLDQSRLDHLGATVGGRTDPAESTVPVVLDADAPFTTHLDLAPVYGDGRDGEPSLCLPRATVAATRWLLLDLDGVDVISDLSRDERYRTDADGNVRVPGVQSPFCIALPGAPADDAIPVEAVSLSGHHLDAATMPAGPHLRQTAALVRTGASAAGGADSGDTSDGVATTLRFETAGDPGASFEHAGELVAIDEAAVDLVLFRGTGSEPDGFLATLTWETPQGSLRASAVGEAMRIGPAWQLRGRAELTGGSWDIAAGRSAGGFVATLETNDLDATDDRFSWRIDATPSASP